MSINTTWDLSRRGLAIGFISWLGLCFTVAMLGGLFMPGEWYTQLKKPPWNPPNWIFGPVWTVLYVIMAVSAWMVWKNGRFKIQRLPLTLFLVQLFFNSLWSPIFFGLHNPLLALADILLLWSTLVGTLVVFWKVDVMAALLLVPYGAWVTFAAVLNFTIWRLNA